MRRAVLFALLSVLLLSMQVQGQVHPYSHVAGHAAGQERGLVSPAQPNGECLECSLLAGGFSVVPSWVAPQAQPSPTPPAFPDGAPGRPAEAPAWFRSRAPPALA